MNIEILALGMPTGAEWIAVLVVVLLLFGAKKLPQLARGVGKSMGEFKKARDEFETEIKRGEHEASTKEAKETKKESDNA